MISFIEAFKIELTKEAEQTRRMLQQAPADKQDYAPHEKSMKLGVLAVHLATIPDMIVTSLLQDKWDFGDGPWNPPTWNTTEELLAIFDKSYQEAMDALNQSEDGILEKEWQLTAGEAVYLSIPKWEAVRHAFGQNAHHRAQLGVFLRLLDIPIPGPYGPSADESNGLI